MKETTEGKKFLSHLFEFLQIHYATKYLTDDEAIFYIKNEIQNYYKKSSNK